VWPPDGPVTLGAPVRDAVAAPDELAFEKIGRDQEPPLPWELKFDRPG
jgi:hypothetical protein